MNKLYFGDNLFVLRERINPGTVDLVYLDPPFNSQAQYNVIYESAGDRRETAQRTVFHDAWSWGDEAETCLSEVSAHGGRVAAVVEALVHALRRSDMMAYVAMMAARLIEIHRVLKPTGSLYLHCDPAASHYLKVVLDAIFGPENFKNEVIWKRTSAHSSAKRYGPIHDVILFYTKSSKYHWTKLYQPYDDDYIDLFFDMKDADGRRWKRTDLTGAGTRRGETGLPWRGIDVTAKGRHWAYPPSHLDKLDATGRIHWPEKADGMPRLKQYPEDLPGVPLQDIVTDVRPLHNLSKERLGFPTQKPLSLLRRLIQASSKPGDVILDPFCGCGTSVHAAQILDRQWIGIDVSYYGIRLVQRRLAANFGPQLKVAIDGIPADLPSAEDLANRDPYAFQQWAVGELGCQLWNDGKKGADGGIDGEMRFFNGPGKPGRLLAQVKGGRRVGPEAVRAFKAVLDTEKVEMGVFFCRNEPTPEMRRAAAAAGRHNIGSTDYPRLQIFSLPAWASGQRPQMPTPLQFIVPADASTRRTRRARRADPTQPEFTFVIEGGLGSSKDGKVVNPSLLPEQRLRVVAS